jgi:excisionase family DNA binding protein
MAAKRVDLKPPGHPALVGVRWVDGAVALIVSGDVLVELAALLDRAHIQHMRSGQPPIPALITVVRAARHASAVNALTSGRVPLAEHGIAPETTKPRRWITTHQAAETLGITDRAVRQRITRGRLQARRQGRDYLIDSLDLKETA